MCNLGDTLGRSKVVPCNTTGVFVADGIVSSEWWLEWPSSSSNSGLARVVWHKKWLVKPKVKEFLINLTFEIPGTSPSGIYGGIGSSYLGSTLATWSTGACQLWSGSCNQRKDPGGFPHSVYKYCSVVLGWEVFRRCQILMAKMNFLISHTYCLTQIGSYSRFLFKPNHDHILWGQH